MPELRYNQITGHWVILAKERAHRPEDLVDARRGGGRPAVPAWDATCPFCVGNEARSEQPTYVWPGTGQWQVRVVPNRYAALSAQGQAERHGAGYWRTVEGTGWHEVIVETPHHNRPLDRQSPDEVAQVLRAYRDRMNACYADPLIRHVAVFRNHGRGAGASLRHPHSQLMGTPVVPGQVRQRLEAALAYWGDDGECLFCHCLREECDDGRRVVAHNERFVALVPFAALSPFHLWIFPTEHHAYFGDVIDEDLMALAEIVREVLVRLRVALDDPDTNLVIRSTAPTERAVRYFHWYMSIVPRLSKAAGFELGSGMFINTVEPAASAEYLRSVDPIERELDVRCPRGDGS
jgi:UDPglucose--hexose-1-phosphate uridylyltransferase